MSKALSTASKILSIAALIPGPQQPFVAIAAAATSIGAQLLAKPPAVQGNISQMIIDPNAPQPYAMGEIFFSGVLRHREGYGGTVSGVANPYMLDIVDYGGGGPYESITPQIQFAAISSWYSGYLATDTQLGECPEASALTASYGTPGGWTSSHKLSGQAAIAWNYKFDKKGKKFASGLPQTGALIEGAKVYDPRLDDTFPGGVGPHRLGDETTYEYSENPALHAGTYAYGRYQNSKRTLGIGLPADGIDWQTLASWANVCETNDWTISGIAFEPGDKGQNLINICAAGGAEPVPGGTLSFRYHAPAVSLDTITEADIADEDMRVVVMQSYRDRVNIVLPKYRSPDHNWELVQADPVSDPDFVTEDGEERPLEWPFNFVKNVDQAAQLAAYQLFDARELHPIELTCLPRLRAYRPGDCLELDLPQLGLSTDAILLHREIDPATMKVKLTLIGETPAKHAWALGLTGDAPATPAIGQSPQDLDETASSGSTQPTLTVADETAMLALGDRPGQVVIRSDNGYSYQHNGGTSGTAADWTQIGSTTLSGDLAAIEALTGTGIPARTAADTWALRTLTAPSAGLTITNPAGVAGNPTFALANDLAGLEGLASNGLATRTALDTWVVRTLTGTANEITVSNGDGVSANPTLSLPSAITLTGKTMTGGTFSGITLGGTTTLPGSGSIDSSGYITPGAAGCWTNGSKSSVNRIDFASGSFRFILASNASGPIDGSTCVMSTAYKIASNQVVGARQTGWGAATGTATRTAIATYTAPTISNPPTQSEVQGIADAVQAWTRRSKALTDDLTSHGLIGT